METIINKDAALSVLMQFAAGNDSIRQNMTKPSEVCYNSVEYYVASDSFTLVLMPKSRIQTSVALADKYPNVLAVIDTLKNEETKEMFASTIDDFIQKCPLIDEKSAGMKCSECYGDGEIECPHCGNEMECDACNGSGYTERPKLTGAKVADKGALFSLYGFKYPASVLLQVKSLLDLSNVRSFSICKRSENGTIMFSVADMFMLCMPNLGEQKPFAEHPSE